MKRIFFAIPIPEAISTALLLPFKGMHVHGVRWITQEQLHITVYFAGEVTEEVLQTIHSTMPVLCQSKTAFYLAFENLRLLYKNKKPAMLWAGFKEHYSFIDLSLSISKIFSAPPPPEQTPHITLARIRQLPASVKRHWQSRQPPYRLTKTLCKIRQVNRINSPRNFSTTVNPTL